MLTNLLRSRLRAKVLGWLFSHPDERYFVRQLTGLLKEDSTNISRELARLEMRPRSHFVDCVACYGSHSLALCLSLARTLGPF